MDGGSLTVPAVFSTLNATLRIASGVYELKAVGEQTRDLLDSTEHVSNSLQVARTIRRQKSIHLDLAEKKWIDDVLVNTEKTLNNVAVLIEPARVDMQTKFGRIGLFNRGLFVFRDSPKVATNLARLNLASQSLNAAMNILCTREGHARVSSPSTDNSARKDRGLSIGDALKSPPTYEESEFLTRRRKSPALKRQTVRSREENEEIGDDISIAPSSAGGIDTDVTGLGIKESPTTSEGSSLVTPLEQWGLCEEKIVVESGNSPSEALPKSNEDMTLGKYEGSDGLQVCDIWEDRESQSQSYIRLNPMSESLQWQCPASQRFQAQQPSGRFTGSSPTHYRAYQPQSPPAEHGRHQRSQEQQVCPPTWHGHPHSSLSPPEGLWQQQWPSSMSTDLREDGQRLQRLELSPASLRTIESNSNLSLPHTTRPSIHPSTSLQSLVPTPPDAQANVVVETSPHHHRSGVLSTRTSTTTLVDTPSGQARNVGYRSRGRDRRLAWLEYQSSRR